MSTDSQVIVPTVQVKQEPLDIKPEADMDENNEERATTPAPPPTPQPLLPESRSKNIVSTLEENVRRFRISVTPARLPRRVTINDRRRDDSGQVIRTPPNNSHSLLNSSAEARSRRIAAKRNQTALYKLRMLSAYALFIIVSALLMTVLAHYLGVFGATKQPQLVSQPLSIASGPLLDNYTSKVQLIAFDNISLPEDMMNVGFSHKFQETIRQLKSRNLEYEERIQFLEMEISNLREEFSKKLAEKEETLKKVVRAISAFREEHVSIPIENIMHFFVVLLSCIWLGYVCWYVSL